MDKKILHQYFKQKKEISISNSMKLIIKFFERVNNVLTMVDHSKF